MAININTIIDNIKYAISSSHNGKIEISDNSFLLNLLRDNLTIPNENDSFSACEPWKMINENGEKVNNPNKWKHRFPISYFFLMTFIYVVDLIIQFIYWSAGKLRRLFLGKNKDLSLSPRFNFVLFTGFIVLYIIAIIFILVFFVKSVLLFNPKSSVNEQGAITIPQSCGVEHYIYMFNAAEPWANTGIKVLKGDEIKVSASGSFYGKISQMNNCAEDNDTLPFSRIVVSSELKLANDSIRELLMYKEKQKAKFGSLLMQIKEDWEDPSYDSDDNTKEKIKELGARKAELVIKKGEQESAIDKEKKNVITSPTPQTSGGATAASGYHAAMGHTSTLSDWEDPSYDSDDNRGKIVQLNFVKEKGFDVINVDTPGVLCFAVNDIYFTPKIVKKISYNKDLQKKLEIESVKYNKDHVPVLFDSIVADSIVADSIQKDMWFYDNVGEILLSIDVTRNNISKAESMPNGIVKAYRWLETKILRLKKMEILKYTVLGIIFMLIWLGFDYMIGMKLRK